MQVHHKKGLTPAAFGIEYILLAGGNLSISVRINYRQLVVSQASGKPVRRSSILSDTDHYRSYSSNQC